MLISFDRFAEHVGKQYSGVGPCRACVGNCGKLAGFTCCELTPDVCDGELQLVSSRLSVSSSKPRFGELILCSCGYLVDFVLAALLFGALLLLSPS